MTSILQKRLQNPILRCPISQNEILLAREAGPIWKEQEPFTDWTPNSRVRENSMQIPQNSRRARARAILPFLVLAIFRLVCHFSARFATAGWYLSSNTVLGEGGTERAIRPQDEWALSGETNTDTHGMKF